VSEAFRLCYHVVRHDVFPRFVQSDHHREMGVLHLSNMLRHADFRAVFLPALDAKGKELVDFWHAANTWREQHTSLASGWASEKTIGEAKDIWRRHAKTARSLDATAARMVDARIFEAPVDLFSEMQVLAINQLRLPYETFLSTAPGVAMFEESGFKRLPAPAPAPSHAPEPYSSRRTSNDLDNYAAGW